MVIIFLQNNCVFKTQNRQNVFRICTNLLNSTRQNVYYFLIHSHMAYSLYASSVRSHFILFAQSFTFTSVVMKFHFLVPFK